MKLSIYYIPHYLCLFLLWLPWEHPTSNRTTFDPVICSFLYSSLFPFPSHPPPLLDRTWRTVPVHTITTPAPGSAPGIPFLRPCVRGVQTEPAGSRRVRCFRCHWGRRAWGPVLLSLVACVAAASAAWCFGRFAMGSWLPRPFFL